MQIQPIKFKPQLKQTLWGGDRIIPFKHLRAEALQGQPADHIGESWEISGVEGHETVVAGGPYDGKKLNELVMLLKEQLVGRRCYELYGDEFPLLIKFIDARKDLSIQVHPNDEIARKQGFPRGKTEMWYLMDSAPDARIYSGLRLPLTAESYAQRLADDTICEAVAQFPVKEGDVFFLPAGRIHAIGAGCFLTEIQQTSDVTWRIYDYKRKDKDGNYRQLHTQQAAESIDYTVQEDYQTHYEMEKNHRNEVVACPYFVSAVYDVAGELSLDYSEHDAFVILIGVKGEGELVDEQGHCTTLKMGETVLLPATATYYRVTGTLRFVETTIPLP